MADFEEVFIKASKEKLKIERENNGFEMAYSRIHSAIDKDELIDEYKKFLEIRNIDKNCSPSDLIDELWHQHILDTQSYINYCLKKFNRVIHHNPNDSKDQDKRNERIKNTIRQYREKYSREPNYLIWGLFDCNI